MKTITRQGGVITLYGFDVIVPHSYLHTWLASGSIEADDEKPAGYYRITL